jgi:transposase
MLKVDQYSYIRTAHRVYGKNIKQIAQETGHSKNTVRKVLRGEYSGYTPRVEQPYPVLGRYLNIIDQWLIDDKKQPKKQRHTAVRVFNRLKAEHDFQGAETTVRRYVREAKLRLGVAAAQVFIPSDPQAGVEAEIDWGGCIAIIGGIETQLKLFCMRSKFSGKHFVRCYPCERQQALFDGHIRGFEFFNGVFPVVIYDNLTTAVQKILCGKARILQQSYEKFRGYYNYSPRFCNPGQGHEKGRVENAVGYVKKNLLAGMDLPDFAAIHPAARHWLDTVANVRIHGETREPPIARFEKERARLNPLPPHRYDIATVCQVRASSQFRVAVDANRYSVPADR